MAFAYLMAAVVSGFIGAAIWIVSGGSLLSAAGVYVLTGNLSMAALFARDFLAEHPSRPFH